MDREEERAIAQMMREAIQRARGYADYFGWPLDRDMEEVGVVQSLAETLDSDKALFFSDIRGRSRPNDPPDCEALSEIGERIAIEVTELVDGDAIRAYKSGRVYEWAEWSRERFLEDMAGALRSKDSRFPKLKEPPYPGGYVVVVHTDEPLLNYQQIGNYLLNYKFPRPAFISRAFLILGYEPKTGNCPYFELEFDG